MPVDGTTQASTSPLLTRCPRLGKPRGPGSSLPAMRACTLPPALGSMTTLPESSKDRGSAASITGRVRTPI